MREIPDELKILSEAIEPCFAHVIGKFFAQCEYHRKRHSTSCVYFVDACGSWWYTMQAMNRMTIGIDTAIHASIAISNQMRMVDDYIKEHLGFSPFFDKHKELDNSSISFRELAKDLELGCIFDNSMHVELDNY